MTIEAWNIVLSAVILVLLTGGGLWLKYVVDQQLKSKDTAIQALESVIKIKDAHVASLEGNTAPAIVKAYADMRQHANDATGEAERLSAQLAEVKKQRKSGAKTHQVDMALVEAHILYLAFDIIRDHIGSVLFPDEGEKINPIFADEARFGVLYDGYMAVLKQLGVEMDTRIKTASEFAQKVEEALKGQPGEVG